jgi:hypothetical protein
MGLKGLVPNSALVPVIFVRALKDNLVNYWL